MKQLEKDALLFALKFRAGLHEGLTNDETEIIFREKFAELIVRESIMCAEREWVRNGDTEHNRAVSKVIGSIKQYFGVKE